MSVLWLLALAAAAAAFPTSSNIIPTADMLDRGQIRVEMENDGGPGPLMTDSENYALFQYAPSDRLEVGVDFYSVGTENRGLLNAKWLARPEGAGRPALALGVLEVGTGYSPTTYLVGTKDIGRGLRLHVGGAWCDGDKAALLGGELQLGKADYLLADWASWRSGYASLGLYHELDEGAALNIAYAWANDHDEQGFWLINFARTVDFRWAR